MKQINKDSVYESCMELREMLNSLEEGQPDVFFEEFIFEVQVAYVRLLAEQRENE